MSLINLPYLILSSNGNYSGQMSASVNLLSLVLELPILIMFIGLIMVDLFYPFELILNILKLIPNLFRYILNIQKK